jgi:hypothetical protein
MKRSKLNTMNITPLLGEGGGMPKIAYFLTTKLIKYIKCFMFSIFMHQLAN